MIMYIHKIAITSIHIVLDTYTLSHIWLLYLCRVCTILRYTDSAMILSSRCLLNLFLAIQRQDIRMDISATFLIRESGHSSHDRC